MKALCLSCRWYIYRTARVNDKPKEWAACEKQIVSFPEAMACRDYEREPGSDDE